MSIASRTAAANVEVKAGSLLARVRAHREEILAIAERFGVTEVRVFGSAVRGDEHSDSDIDLLAKLPEKLSLFDLVDLADELSTLLCRKVDLTDVDNIHPYYVDYILPEAVSL